MNLFYCGQLMDSTEGILSPEESYHCFKVLRLKSGESILITDGKGNAAEAKIIKSDPEKTEWKLSKLIKTNHKPLYRLHIGISPLKNAERLEWFAEKATELGIHEITTVLCRRTEKKSANTQRLKKTVLSAMKQSMQYILPEVHQLTDFEIFINQQPSKSLKLICSQHSDVSVQQAMKRTMDISVLIGPEGDFTREEIESALSAGFQPVSLGHARLRTETAGLYICSILKSLFSD